MSSVAYLLAIFNEHGQLESISIYSERHPTMLFKYTSAVIHEAHGDTYADARQAIINWAAGRGEAGKWVLDAINGFRPGMSTDSVRNAAAQGAATLTTWYDSFPQKLMPVQEKTLPEGRALTTLDKAQHALFVSREIYTILEEGRREKAMRWLGFLQGYLWAIGATTVEQLKTLNADKKAV